MIEETLVISDTNILLDLIYMNLLNEFFSLPCGFRTTDFVMNEIVQPVQQKKIDEFVKAKKLEVVSFGPSELSQIIAMFSNSTNNVSLTDCSVWYHAKRTDGRLLTGDGKLRRSAEADNVKVAGILYIIDKNTAADLLGRLMQINMRLPKGECEKRILSWRDS